MKLTPRLRVTSLLSLLALLIGVLGTQWLSGRTAEWDGPDHAVTAVHTAPAPRAARQPRRRVRYAPVQAVEADPGELRAAVAAVPPTLVPLSMPQLADRYDAMRGHLQGNVVLSVSIDAAGKVRSLTVRRTSGDAVLDRYAQRLVTGWRFAVPADHPAGMTGDLPMHFGTDATARP
jgi:protein TonB